MILEALTLAALGSSLEAEAPVAPSCDTITVEGVTRAHGGLSVTLYPYQLILLDRLGLPRPEKLGASQAVLHLFEGSRSGYVGIMLTDIDGCIMRLFLVEKGLFNNAIEGIVYGNTTE